LREIDVKSDNLSEYLGWLQDVENNVFIQSARADYTQDELRKFIELTNDDASALLFGLFLKDDGQFIGTIKLQPIDFNADLVWVGMMIGNPEFRGKGYGREALQAVLEFIFKVLGIGSVYLGVDFENAPAISLYKRIGFEQVESRRSGLIMKIDKPYLL
jgi:RimJ/RimL family protein N-acetyltransferase